MTNPERSCEYFASCPKQLEPLLREELISLGVDSVRETSAGVYFSAKLSQLYRVCLWSRLANRILMPLAREKCASADDVYNVAAKLPWEEHFSEQATLIVDFIGSNDQIRHTQFGAQKLKDAVVDRFWQKRGARPSVDKKAPDIRINAYLTKSDIVISIDVTGESLHRRGYRLAKGAAPLKENLAAALLIRAGWQTMVTSDPKQPLALLDPMCGSGTLLIEAALMAANIAPGLMRKRFGFERLHLHNQECWLSEREKAKMAAIAADSPDLPHIEGFDVDREVLRYAKQNIADAGLTAAIQVSQRPLHAFSLPQSLEHIKQGGLFICNPPYGERLGEIDALRADYRELGQVAKRELAGWRLAVFTSNRELGQEMRLRPKNRYKFFNGRLPAELLICEVLGDELRLREDKPGEKESKPRGEADTPEALSDGAVMVSNRLIKNQKRLNKWLARENIQCYRLYDADMPEYSAAIDVYGDYYHIQEYQAPKKVDKQKARQRFQEIEHAVANAFDVPKDRIFCKTRMRTKGHTQYEKQSHSAEASYIEVSEGKAQLLVNLQDYLDTGLFLDHRPLRELIGSSVAGKRFLNLFCYTATASVHAALGGAQSSVSVDLSNTYLDWARRNFELNNINSSRHQLVRADCVEWLRNCRQGFDVIMLDPPTFSNSKSVDTVLDIQKDHVALVNRCMELLSPGGVLFFSNNLRSFKLDESALDRYHVVNMTRESLGPDFERNPKIHSCWKILHP